MINIKKNCREYRSEWEKIKVQMDTKQLETEQASSNLCFTVPAGAELSDVFLRQPGDNSSEDSEGEEAEYDGELLIYSTQYF